MIEITEEEVRGFTGILIWKCQYPSGCACQECGEVKEIVESVAKHTRDTVPLAMVAIRSISPGTVANQYGICSLPTTMALHNGRILLRAGAVPENPTLEEMVELVYGAQLTSEAFQKPTQSIWETQNDY